MVNPPPGVPRGRVSLEIRITGLVLTFFVLPAAFVPFQASSALSRPLSSLWDWRPAQCLDARTSSACLVPWRPHQSQTGADETDTCKTSASVRRRA